MNTAIAVLTYNRRGALDRLLQGLTLHCSAYPIAVFEDCGMRDDTRDWLSAGRELGKSLWEIEADRMICDQEAYEVYLGHRNLGVAGNSNRALAWAWQRGYDHLCLCNDDLFVHGDFAAKYAEAHDKLGIGLFCHCGISTRGYETAPVNWRGIGIRVLSRLTGSMMSITRQCIHSIGFFDTRCGRFGQEHCDYTYRASSSGLIKVNGIGQVGLDVAEGSDLLEHQDVASTASEAERPLLDAVAARGLSECAALYEVQSHYRPFQTSRLKTAGGRLDGSGVPTCNLPGYKLFNYRVTSEPTS